MRETGQDNTDAPDGRLLDELLVEVEEMYDEYQDEANSTSVHDERQYGEAMGAMEALQRVRQESQKLKREQ